MRPSFVAQLSTAFLLAATFSIAQTPAPAKHAFEVVSIRPNKTGPWSNSWAITPDGYRVNAQSIWSTIMIAYFPQGPTFWFGGLQGGPPWLNDTYAINARVSSSDLPEWQKQGTALDKVPMLREMLQTMLADRCKLVFHRVPRSLEGYAVVVGKRGPKVALAKANAPLPPGIKLADGGVAVGFGGGEVPKWDFHSGTMADLVRILSSSSPSHPIVDHTGLNGKFDFVLRCGESDMDHPDRACSSFANPDALMLWDWASLGLRLEPVKIPADTLVIDHIEKPSEN